MSMGYSNVSLPGLSGYDFSGITDVMVQNYSLPLNQMTEKQGKLELAKNAWRDVNTRLSALENTLNKLTDSSTWGATTASSSNSDILKVSSKPGTTQGNYKVIVEQLAVAQTAVSSVQSVDKASSSLGLGAGSFTITVGDKTTKINIAAGASLEKIAEAINNAKADVGASVIKVGGGYQLALISKDTGLENAAVFKDESGHLLQSLGVLQEDAISGETVLNVSQGAQDARISINGITNITSASNQVTSAIPGLTLDLQRAALDSPVLVQVTASSKEAEAAVKAFVDQYNSVMNFIESKLKLNQETKAKGDLYGDPILQGIQSRLRNLVGGRFDNPGGKFNNLADLGIATSGLAFGKSAVLEFDTAKFQKAMQENPDAVANLFGARAGGVEPVAKSSENEKAQGLANIMKEYLNPLVKYDGSLDKTQKNYEKQIDQVKKQIEDFNIRLEAYAERTRLRFVNLEMQLSALNSQNEWLSNQVDAMNYNRRDR